MSTYCRMADTSKKKRVSEFGAFAGRHLGQSYPQPRCRSAQDNHQGAGDSPQVSLSVSPEHSLNHMHVLADVGSLEHQSPHYRMP